MNFKWNTKYFVFVPSFWLFWLGQESTRTCVIILWYSQTSPCGSSMWSQHAYYHFLTENLAIPGSGSSNLHRVSMIYLDELRMPPCKIPMQLNASLALGNSPARFAPQISPRKIRERNPRRNSSKKPSENQERKGDSSNILITWSTTDREKHFQWLKNESKRNI